MNENEVKKHMRDWMYKWGYFPKGYSFFHIDLNGILNEGKLMIPFYNPKDYNGIGNYLIVDDLFELEVPNRYLNVDDYPFKFGKDNLPPKNIVLEYKGTKHGIDSLYAVIGQSMVYHCFVKLPVYLVIDIENYLRLKKVFDVLPFGIISYRIKCIDDGIKVIKHSDSFVLV